MKELKFTYLNLAKAEKHCTKEFSYSSTMSMGHDFIFVYLQGIC